MNTPQPGVRESRADFFISIGLLTFCAFAAAQTARLKIPPNSGMANPTFVPWLMIVLISLCSVVLLARSLARQKRGEGGYIELPNRRIFLKMGLFIVLMLVYAIALMPVGYIWTTLVVLAVGLLILGERNPWTLILFPLAMTLAVYFGFTKLLAVWLP